MRALLGPAVAVVVLVSSALASREAIHERGDGEAPFRAAARAFLAALRPESRQRACFGFDDPLRLDWHFVPRERQGLPLGAMSDDERRAAHALLRAFLAPRGYGRVLGVIELEGVLRELEKNPGRDPGRYFFSVFGDVGGGEEWSLRVEGHHLALNFTGEGVDGLAPTPFFLGANPAEVRSGPRAGFKLLAPHEEQARALVKSLTPDQLAKARIAETAPADVLFGPGKPVAPDPDQGLSLGQLTGEQLGLARALVAELVDVVAPAGGAPLPPIAAVGTADALALTRFAWAGGLEPGQGHYWRLSGPRFVFEYDDTQDGANHVHFLWRDPQDDFAAAWLARHKDAER
jgi:hypothetical protein